MWEINESFKDSTEFSGFVSIYLNADKPLNPYHISYPITWSGFINNEPIEILQATDSSKYMKDFEFIKYPEKGYHIYQNSIVDLINKYFNKSMN